MRKSKKIVLVSPHGFCAGVDRAIRMMELAIEKYGSPVYCLNEIVHNAVVVEDFSERGVIFVKDLKSVPRDSALLFSAHGVSPAVRAEANDRGLNVIDATCPFVDKIHREVQRWADAGKTVFLVGHRAHEEIVGISGEAPENVVIVENAEEALAADIDESNGVAVATQTTLSQEETERIISSLADRFSDLEQPSRGDICYATLNRQKAVRALSGVADFVLVIGSKKSSNTNRLVEVARSVGLDSALIDSVEALADITLEGVDVVGVTAGASTPESFTGMIMDELAKVGFDQVDPLEVVHEDCRLTIPEI